jgi:hypothetical protein
MAGRRRPLLSAFLRPGTAALRQALQKGRFQSKTPVMRALNEDLIKAVDLALADDWDAARQLVQQHENLATAAWIHAVLHKIEGDAANRRYWYQHADRMEHVGDEPRGELAAIKDELMSRGRK